MTFSVEIPETAEEQRITSEFRAVVASVFLFTLNIQTAEDFPDVTGAHQTVSAMALPAHHRLWPQANAKQGTPLAVRAVKVPAIRTLGCAGETGACDPQPETAPQTREPRPGCRVGAAGAASGLSTKPPELRSCPRRGRSRVALQTPFPLRAGCFAAVCSAGAIPGSRCPCRERRLCPRALPSRRFQASSLSDTSPAGKQIRPRILCEYTFGKLHFGFFNSKLQIMENPNTDKL